MGEEKRTAAQVVGQNMRRIRESRAKVLLDVANAARDLGLTWDASQVSRIERAQRELTLEEFLALPLVMTLALDETVTMVDLLAEEEDDYPLLTSYGRTTSLLEIRLLLAEPFMVAHNFKGKTKISELVRDDLNQSKREAQAKREPADDEGGSWWEHQKVAKDLGAKSSDVFKAYQELWDTVSFSTERERRLVKSGVDLSSPTSVRTHRGHITRQLMAELRDHLTGRRD